ncbi:MAG TPA: MATE family efflux transporter [Tissierellia bacterium]|nr:MATE family efflux transporter [Tissierellia bacterium]
MNIKQLFQSQDMTIGKPWHKILIFSIPLLLSNIAQQLYSTVDSIVVGRFIGDDAIASVNASMPIIMMLMVFFVSISSGSSVMVSQYFGARQREDLSRSIGVTLSLTFIASVFIMIVGPLVAPGILRLMQTQPRYFDWSVAYLQIILFGIMGFAYYNILAGILRGLGDSSSSLLFIVIATIINIVLDLIFVAVFHMGVPGVAIATLIAQAISALLTLWRLRKYDEFDLKFEYLKLKPKFVKQLLMLGLPTGLTQMIFSMAMVFTQSLTNLIDVAAVTGIVMRVDGFAMQPNFSFGIAMATFTGQNIGAGRIDRVVEGRKQGLILALITTTIITGLIVVFGKNLMYLFSSTEALVDLAYNMMLVLTIGYLAFTVTQVLGGIQRGAGDTVTPMYIAIFNTVIVRVPLAYLIAHLTKTPEWPHGKPIALFLSLVITWILGAILNAIAYAKGKWKTKALTRAGARPSIDA